MQTANRKSSTPSTSLDQRRDIPDLARLALDLRGVNSLAEPGTTSAAACAAVVRPRAYPSPPMSGSSPSPLDTAAEAGERGQRPGSRPTASPQDAYRRGSAPTAPERSVQGLPLPPPPPSQLTASEGRHYLPEQHERLPYPYHRQEEARPASAPYPGGLGPRSHPPPPNFMSGPSQPYASGQGPLPPMAQAHPLQSPSNPQQPSQQQQQQLPNTEEGQAAASPKSQRKTKGHVASACVPCKKAHLRCDARRPCSRCLGNGKEDACIDVQHKKRGRPRLRDDREVRYGPTGYSHPPEAGMRRPLSLYSSGGPVSGESAVPRYLERASAADANIYAPHISTGAHPQEPVAYLNLNMDIVKASPIFLDAIGLDNVRGRPLADIVAPQERAKIQGHKSTMQEDRERRDPLYLPPIYGREQEERVFDSLRFDAEELSRMQLDRHDVFAFGSQDGQWRPFNVRMGTVKRESIYITALVLLLPPGYLHSTPSPHTREAPYAYAPQTAYQQQPPPRHGYPQPSPLSITHDPAGRPRLGEGSLAPQLTLGHQHPSIAGFSPGPSPGLSPGIGSYAASPSRLDYAGGPSSQIPRSELSTATRPPPPPQTSFQLPPIRSSPQQPPTQTEQPTRRDDRSGRVDIGGLIDKPDQPSEPHNQPRRSQ